MTRGYQERTQPLREVSHQGQYGPRRRVNNEENTRTRRRGGELDMYNFTGAVGQEPEVTRRDSGSKVD